jgi:hypothetical protein
MKPMNLEQRQALKSGDTVALSDVNNYYWYVGIVVKKTITNVVIEEKWDNGVYLFNLETGTGTCGPKEEAIYQHPIELLLFPYDADVIDEYYHSLSRKEISRTLFNLLKEPIPVGTPTHEQVLEAARILTGEVSIKALEHQIYTLQDAITIRDEQARHWDDHHWRCGYCNMKLTAGHMSWCVTLTHPYPPRPEVKQ